MLSEDREMQEVSERGFRGIVLGAESSITNMKKQLLTIQTLRIELARKEDIIDALNQSLSAIERKNAISAGNSDQNRILVERSARLESALKISKKELAATNGQLNFHTVQSDTFKGEVEALVNELSNLRNRSEYNTKELSIARTQLETKESAYQDIQNKCYYLQHQKKDAEQALENIRIDSKVKLNNMERELQHLRDKITHSERKLQASEARADNQANIASEWMSKYERLKNNLSEKQFEADHWRKIYAEQVLHKPCFVDE